MNKKFEYYLNAIHYSLWLSEIRFQNRMNKIVDVLYSPIEKYLYTKKLKKKLEEQQAEIQEAQYNFFYNKKTGWNVAWAHHWFGYFYSGYASILSFVLLGMAFGIWGDDVNQIEMFVIVMLPIGLAYIPAYRAVFTNDRYLKYFRQFEKEDEQWHKKWKRRTIAFCVGSVAVIIGGIFAMWGVDVLFRE